MQFLKKQRLMFCKLQKKRKCCTSCKKNTLNVPQTVKKTMQKFHKSKKKKQSKSYTSAKTANAKIVHVLQVLKKSILNVV